MFFYKFYLNTLNFWKSLLFTPIYIYLILENSICEMNHSVIFSVIN